jgi:hypothetical protein
MRELEEESGQQAHQLIALENRHPEGIGADWEKFYDDWRASLDKSREAYADADFQFFGFGLAAPPFGALAIWWITLGFRRTRARQRATPRLNEDVESRQ